MLTCSAEWLFFFCFSSQGHLINAVAWNKSKLTESSTQTILLGTTKGYPAVVINSIKPLKKVGYLENVMCTFPSFHIKLVSVLD